MPSMVVQESPEGAVLTVHVQPKAARTEAVGLHGDAFKVRVAAPPTEGSANEELCRYLARACGVAKTAIVIQAGQTVRRKRVLIKNVPAGCVRERLGIPA